MFQGRSGIALAFVVGLVIAAAGTATAAKLITGKQIKDGSIGKKDLSKAVRALLARTGSRGPQGNTGAEGPKGDRGVSAWETIPSGVTVRGSEAIELPSDGIGANYVQTIPLGARAPEPLVNSAVNFAPDALTATTDDDAACTGTIAAPTAPPGKVCLYAGGMNNVNNATGASHIFGKEYSFRVGWSSTIVAPEEMFLTFTWAYTAP